MNEDKRFVRGRCPVCQDTSPVCDQVVDIHRRTVGDWWYLHLQTHMPWVIWEVVPGNELDW